MHLFIQLCIPSFYSAEILNLNGEIFLIKLDPLQYRHKENAGILAYVDEGLRI